MVAPSIQPGPGTQTKEEDSRPEPAQQHGDDANDADDADDADADDGDDDVHPVSQNSSGGQNLLKRRRTSVDSRKSKRSKLPQAESVSNDEGVDKELQKKITEKIAEVVHDHNNEKRASERHQVEQELEDMKVAYQRESQELFDRYHKRRNELEKKLDSLTSE